MFESEMSATTRRRSRGAGEAETPPADMATSKRRARHPTLSRILKIAIISLVIAGLYLTWYLRNSNRSAKPFSAPSYHGVSPDSGVYVLHPEKHASRDATSLKHRWRVTRGLRRPDGVLKEVYLINDAFPGPTIEARSGDRLVIEVENGLQDEGVSIHWHGLSMRDANSMDGAVGITQDSIQPGSSFTYNFMIEEGQHGTFWYHGHDQVQRADGLFGGLVVHELRKTQAIDAERLLLIGDWYHRSATDALEFYMHPGSFGNEPVPDSILLNGNGAFNCMDAVPARPLDCKQCPNLDLPALELGGSKPTILRVVNVGSYAGFELSIDDAQLMPFRVDGGHRVLGRAARRVGILEPGERVDLRVDSMQANQLAKSSFLRVTLDTAPFKFPNSALTPKHSFPLKWPISAQTSTKSSGVLEFEDLQDLAAIEDQSSVLPTVADTTMVLYTITQKLSHLRNEPHGFINSTSWKPHTTPAIPLISVDRSLWDKNQFVPLIAYERYHPLWVDIILNNLDEEAHPFHLHGYDFWILSTYSSTYNWGSYNPFEDEEAPGGQYNIATPVKKDTVLVPRRGYAVLRFRADNPGVWMFHCHNLWHQASGMAMAIEVSK